MDINRKANLARTSFDKDHINRLLVPEYGVIEIRLKKGDSKKSISYLPKTSTPRREPKTGGEEAFCFAPGTQWKESPTWEEDTAKHDKVAVWYHLFNPFSVITEAKLQLFRRWEETPLWERELKDDELIDGEHELEFTVGEPTSDVKEKLWDGKVTKKDEFPDGFVTAEHSPYMLRLLLKGEGVTTSPIAWTHFHILVHKLELEWGDVECVENVPDKRKPFEMLKDACPKPADGDDSKGRIYLISHIFKKGNSMFDNSLFEKYKTMWGEGPQIPIYAKVWIRDSGGNPVIAPKALGKTKFLWDWESKLEAPTNTFVKNAQDFNKADTKPKGENAHKDLGGKRAHDAEMVFPAQAGCAPATSLTNGTFPFEVKANDDKRKWAAYSTAWTSGKLAGKTGVLFRPSRMAGDKYKLTMYVAQEIVDDTRKPRLNVDTEAPLKIEAALKVETGTFQVWRKMYFRRRMIKLGACSVDVAGIRAFFEKAFVDIEDKTSGFELYPADEWESEWDTVYSGWTNAKVRLHIDQTIYQNAHEHGVHFRTLPEYRQALIDDDLKAVPLPVLAPRQLQATTTVDQYLLSEGINTDATYAARVQGWAIQSIKQIFDKKMPAEDGINLFLTLFSMQRALIANLASFTDGEAYDFPSGSSSKCAFLWLAPSNIYGSAQGVYATPAHEIGHHVMLPHPKNTAENTGTTASNDYGAHDDGVTNCLMSYQNSARELCGFCQLRMRGWDKSKLSTTSATNKKP